MTEKKKFIDKMVQSEILDKFQNLEKSTIEKLKKIAEEFKGKEKAKIALLTHKKRDPDGVSSCAALKRWFRGQGVKSENIEIFADGDPISRETKVMTDKIGVEIHPSKEIDRRKHKVIILLDAASTKQANVGFKYEPDLTIDHHSDEDPYGSTATIMTLLLTIFGYEIEEDLATVLTIGIDTDTDNRTSKKVTEFDTLAYRKILSPLVDDRLWKEIVDCGYLASFREMLSKAISRHKYYFKKESTVISGVGYIKEAHRIYLPKIANFLLDEEGVEKVIVIAIVEYEIKDKEGNVTCHKKFIIPTTRSSTGTENAADLNKRVFGEDLAGGDTFKASGAVPLKNGDIKFIERAKKHKNKEALEGYFKDKLNCYKEKILEEETK